MGNANLILKFDRALLKSHLAEYFQAILNSQQNVTYA
jgi:hypothetical protein